MKIRSLVPSFLFLLTIFIFLYFFLSETRLEKGQKVDFILVEKSKRKMTLYYNEEAVAVYKVSLGAKLPWIFQHPAGQKMIEGDYKTPEGIYTIDSKVSRHRYHRKLHISYPTPSQKTAASKNGLNPGGQILIHGLSPYNRVFGKFTKCIDWTAGCIALTNVEVEEVYEAVSIGCKIKITP